MTGLAPDPCRTQRYKVIILGEVGVGKSSLFLRIKDGTFGINLQPTLGIDSCSRTICVNSQNITLQVWDTAGVERYKTLTQNYFRRSNAVLLVFSLDNPASLHYLARWVADAQASAPHALMFLIGNKSDLERNVPHESVQDFAQAHDIESIYYTSAKTGAGLEEALIHIGKKITETVRRDNMSASMFDDLNPRTKSDIGKCEC